MLQKNDIAKIVITDISSEGFGIGKHDGMAVFVPMTAVGDEVSVRIVKVLKNYCFGIVEEITNPSPDRVPVDCPVYNKCGGCSFRHISYESECRIKNNWLFENLRRIGGVELEPVPIIVSDKIDGYRNKAQYPLGQGKEGVDIGFYARRSHRVIPHKNCLLHPDNFAEILATTESFINRYKIPIYNEETNNGLLRHIYLREGEISGKFMLCLVINGNQVPHSGQFVRLLAEKHPNVTSIILNVNREASNVILGKNNILLFGTENITDTLCGIDVSISPLAFYQINRGGAEKLYRVATEFADLKSDDVVLDLYCGAGTIGLSLAKQAKEVIGVESVPQAVENAKINAKLNDITNIRFICADADEASATLAEEGTRPNVVIVDPPRKGCTPELLKTIAQMAPERFVYVSCNSATMARDIKIMTEFGYTLQKAQAVDMFPRTAHCEAVSLMTK